MLKKIVSIKNIGTFRNNLSVENTEFRQLTLIYGENGRGKSTLCAIFRSLQSNNPNLITERKTLDSDDTPYVEILLESEIVSFKNNSWSSNCPHIEIFDAAFVTDNVHLGDLITQDNKKNLYRIILGAEGIQLAKKFDESDAHLRICNTEVSDAKDAIQKLIPNGITFDQFMGFLRDPDINLKIAMKKSEISILEDSSAIREKQLLSEVDLPQPLPTLTNMLQKTVEGISDDAEKIIRQHIENHKMSDRGETWIAEGLQYALDKHCPFCAQSIEGSSIIPAFKVFFSQAYRSFHQELTQLKAAIDQPLSDAVLLTVQKRLSDNIALTEFWKKYVPNVSSPHLAFNERVQPVIRGLRDSLTPLVSQKIESPLEKVAYSEAANQAIEEWKTLRNEVRMYNTEVNTFNSSVQAVKSTMGIKNLMTLQQELTILETQKFRYESAEINTATNVYSNTKKSKTEAETKKSIFKQDLNEYNATMIDNCRDTVNSILADFGATFTLAKMKIDYIGRAPRTNYTFGIRGKEIDPGTDNTPSGTACFKNALSAGDRSTLALAFFITQLKNRKDLANIIVIFDDPFTNLDSFRRQWTCNMIQQIAKRAKQVIVLSHSCDFLQPLYELHEKASISILKIDRHDRVDSEIVKFDFKNIIN